MKTNPLTAIRHLATALLLSLVLTPVAEAARGRPVLNPARTTFVADNGQLLRGPYESTEWTDAAPQAEIANIRNLGFNAVHLYAESFDPAYPAPGSTAPGYAVAEVDKFVQMTRDLGLYLVVTIGNGANNGDHNRQWALDFWTFYAPRYAHETHVLYEIHNEPVAWGPDYLTATTPPGALAMNIDVYNIIRAHAPDTPVLLFTYAVMTSAPHVLTDIHAFNTAVFGNASAVWTNEVVGFHGYGGWRDTAQTVAALLAAGYPCMMTEFIATPWGGGDEGLDVEHTAELERLGVSWLCFLTIPPYGVSPDVTVPAHYRDLVEKAGLSWTPDFGAWPVYRRPFGNGSQPRATPGLGGSLRIEAEDFDEGGEGVAYHDAESVNFPGQYRAEGVDINGTGDIGGGHYVGWTQSGEWLEYTVFVTEGGRHTLSLRIASIADTQVRVYLNGRDKTGVWTLPSTGGWANWTTVSREVDLEWGRQKIRVEILSSNGELDLNWLELAAAPSGTLPDGVYRIVNRDSGLALASGDPGGQVLQQPVTGDASRLWRFRHLGAGQYRISSVDDAVNWSGSGARGEPLGLVWWWGVEGAHQRFLVRPVPSGHHRLTVALGGNDLETIGASHAAGAGVRTAEYAGGNHQQWAIEAASAQIAPGGLAAFFSAVGEAEVELNWQPVPGAATYAVKRAAASGGPYATIASGLLAPAYRDTGLAPGVAWHYVVTATGPAGESLPSGEASPARLRVHLKLDETAGSAVADATGNGWHGTLVGAVPGAHGRLHRAADFDGVDDYVTLPAGVVAGLADFTVAAWVRLDAANPWSRIFDFGTEAGSYVCLAAANGYNGNIRFAINDGSGEQAVEAGVAIPVGEWAHVAVTLKGGVGILYLNGVEVGRSTWLTLNPGALGVTTLNYLGKSRWADPYLAGLVDDFRIYEDALTSAALVRLIAPVTNGTYRLAARHSGKAVDAFNFGVTDGTPLVQWPYWGGANQQWVVTHVGKGEYSLVGLHSGKAIDIDGWDQADGARVQLWTYLGGTNQRFVFAPTDGGHYRLTPLHAPGSCLDVAGISTADGAPLHLWTYLGGANQQWSFQAP